MKHSIYLGDYVADDYGRLGRVYNVYYSCPQNTDWLTIQLHPFTDAERKERWMSVLVHDGGAIVTCESRLTRVEPFILFNTSEDFYFRPEHV